MKINILLLSIIFLLISETAQTQDIDKTVTITVSGSGKTEDEAKQLALRSAIEQAFGAFISTKTEVLNDQMMSDQITSISNGNIKTFTVLNSSLLPNGNYGTTLNVVVSVSKLASFVQSKGVAIEINGGLFAVNIKQQILNEQAEIKSILDLVTILHETLQNSFDYVIENGNPVSIDAENKNWQIPLKVTAIANKNISFCNEYLFNNLKSISLTSQEVETYKNLNKSLFLITLYKESEIYKFYLRKTESFEILKSIISQDYSYQSSFDYESGINGIKITDFKFDYSKFGNIKNENNILAIILPNLSDTTARFNWNDNLDFNQIENLKGYKVKSKGTISFIKNGGYTINDANGKQLIVSLYDFGKFGYDKAKKLLNEYSFAGYKGWRIPTISEWSEINNNLHANSIGNFSTNLYWSSTPNSYDYPDEKQKYHFGVYTDRGTGRIYKNIVNGHLYSIYGYTDLQVRLVRDYIISNESTTTGIAENTTIEKNRSEYKFYEYLGVYNIKNYHGAKVIITNKDDKIYFAITTKEKNTENIIVEMIKNSNNTFSIPQMNCNIIFNRDNEDKIISLVYMPKKGESFEAFR